MSARPVRAPTRSPVTTRALPSADSPDLSQDVLNLTDMRFRWPGRHGFALSVTEFSVARGETVARLYARDRQAAETAAVRLRAALRLSESAADPVPLVLDRLA